MRRVIGWLLIGIGALALLVGTAVAVAFGTDDTLVLGPHRLSGQGSAIVTAPRVIGYAGPTLHLTATSTDRHARLFLGVGHDVDVRDYLSGTAHTRVDSVSLPWQVDTSAITGQHRALANPRPLTWWLVSATGGRSVSATIPLPDAPIDIAMLDLSSPRQMSVDVTVGIQQQGAFAAALAVLLGGAGLVAGGWAVRRAPLRGRRVAVSRRATA